MPSSFGRNPHKQSSASEGETRGHGEAVLAVIINCYNYEEYVGRAIQSVQMQERNDCELVVVDDGSTDRSWAIIQQNGVRAFRIRNGGQRSACLFGLKQTRAPFVLFLDADDELLPGSIETIIANLDADVAKLQFPLRRVDRDGRALSGPVPALSDHRGRNVTRRILKSGVYTSPPTSGNVFRRDVCELLEEARYDNAVDGVIVFAAPFMGDLVSLSTQLGLYRVHDRNKSGVGGLLEPEALRHNLDRFVNRMNHLRDVLGQLGYPARLVQAEETYYYCERSFYLDILTKRRTNPRRIFKVLVLLWTDDHPLKMKAAMTPFFMLLGLLPKERATRCLAYRFSAETRSAFGLLRALLYSPAR